jgi:hypothetical protein
VMFCQNSLHKRCRMARCIVVMKLIYLLGHCECDGHTVHKLSQRRLTADWLAPQESDCSRMHSKVSSDWLPSYFRVTWLVLEIFRMAGYFPHNPCTVTTLAGYFPHNPCTFTTLAGYFPHNPCTVTTLAGYFPHNPCTVTTLAGYFPHNPRTVTTQLCNFINCDGCRSRQNTCPLLCVLCVAL